MPEPIHIPVSPYQLQRFADFKKELDAVELRINDSITTCVAGQIDPATVRTWDIKLVGAEIVCTPPVERAAP